MQFGLCIFTRKGQQMLILYPNVSYSVQLCMLKDCLRDLFHVCLNKFEFHFLRLHINKTNLLCFLISHGRVPVIAE